MAKSGILDIIESSDQISALLSRLTQLAYGEITSGEVKAWLEEQHPDHKLEYLLDPDRNDGNQSGSGSGEEGAVNQKPTCRRLLSREIRRWIQCAGPSSKEWARAARLSRATPQVLLQSLRLRVAIELLKTVIIGSKAFSHMSAVEKRFISEFPDVVVEVNL